MDQNKENPYWLVLGVLFLVFVVMLCAFSPYYDEIFPQKEPVEQLQCQCPWCTGEIPEGASVFVFTPGVGDGQGVDYSFGGYEGMTPSVDEDGNTVYEYWYNEP